MKFKEIQNYSNPRIRSFLTPFSKYGTRSMSTLQSVQSLSNLNETNKSYIDFKKVSRPINLQVNKNAIKNKFQNITKIEDKKESKLIKLRMNKAQDKHYKQDKINNIQDKNILVVMIRQLKEVVRALQLQNQKLINKQDEDQTKIDKQGEIIKNLEEALALTRYKAISWPFYDKQCLQQKQIELKYQIPPQRKLKQIHEQNYSLSKKYERITSTLNNPQIANYQKKYQLTKKFEEKCQCYCEWQMKLQRLEVQKQKQLNQIDNLLFGQCFD